MAISETQSNLPHTPQSYEAEIQRTMDFATLPEIIDLNRQVYHGLIHPIEYVQQVVRLAVQHGISAEYLQGGILT